MSFWKVKQIPTLKTKRSSNCSSLTDSQQPNDDDDGKTIASDITDASELLDDLVHVLTRNFHSLSLSRLVSVSSSECPKRIIHWETKENTEPL